jgi:hypothetical protein
VHLRRIFTLAIFATLSTLSAAGAQARQANGGPAPAAAVERFLRLAQAKNYQEMGTVFGTESGTVAQRDALGDVERRMFAIASILENERFVIRGEEAIPGRTGTAVRVTVEITKGGRARQVPFVAVRSGEVWLVEQVELERLTRND